MKRIIVLATFLSIAVMCRVYPDQTSLERVRLSFMEEYDFYRNNAEKLAVTLLLEFNGTPVTDRWARSVLGRNDLSVEAMTVESELFWDAFFSRGWNDPNFYLIRACLLMSEGRLDAVWNTLCFTTPSAMSAGEAYLHALNEIWSSLIRMCGYLNRLIEAGSIHMETFGSSEIFDNALYVNPTYSPALVQKGQALMDERNNTGNSEFDDEAEEYFRRARMSDPFYQPAYSYPEDLRPIGDMAHRDLIPVLNTLVDGTTEDLDLMEFADECRRIDAHEFAVYALWIDIGRRIENEDAEDSVNALIQILREMQLNSNADRLPEIIGSLQ